MLSRSAWQLARLSASGPAARGFATSAARQSNIGSAPILLPHGTTLTLRPKELDEVTRMRAALDAQRNGKPRIHLAQELVVDGPQGSVQLDLADFVRLAVEDGRAQVSVEGPTLKHQRAMWGTSRSLVQNAVTGVNEGHLCIVKLVGTGFRAQLEDIPASEASGPDAPKQQIVLRVGFSVPRIAKIPPGLKVTVPVPHRIIIEGVDKQQVKLLAAGIRAFRKPEPYKGKGIFINDETIKLKQKKIK